MPPHVQQLAADAVGLNGVRTAVGDARELDLAEASVDAVLLLGPLYHLRARPQQLRADTARAVERVPEMLGIGPHLLATGVR